MGLLYLFIVRKMRNPEENGFQITIYKSGAYDKTVSFNEWDTVRSVFAKAGEDYEEWTLDDVAYTPESTLWAEDNNGVITIATKQIKQG